MLPERRPSIEITCSPRSEEWALFRRWATHEGWRVPERELSLYGNELAGSAFVLSAGDGCPLGFVTVCRHQRAGWIGNLIIDPARRGEGYGRRLFQHAAGMLVERGAEALWLTASAEGKPLYESCGFREAGRIERWLWQGVGGKESVAAIDSNAELYELVRADAAAWGHSRVELLSQLARGGRIFTSGSTVALIQPGSDLSVLGPWLSADLCPRANRIVLGKVLEAFPAGGELAVDVIGGSPVRLLLHAAGFRQSGETVLMIRGESGRSRLGEVVALASLGSMG